MFWLLQFAARLWVLAAVQDTHLEIAKYLLREGVFAVRLLTTFSRTPICSGPALEMRPSSRHLSTPLCYSINMSGTWSRHAAFLRKGKIPAFNLLLGVLVKSFSNRDTVIRTDEPLDWVVSLIDGPALRFPHLPLHFWAAETGPFIRCVHEGCQLVGLLVLPRGC